MPACGCTSPGAAACRAVSICAAWLEAWLSRFGGGAESIHFQEFPVLPAEWRDEALAARWNDIRRTRRLVTASLEDQRRDGTIGSSLQAAVSLTVPEGDAAATLSAEDWAEILIVSQSAIATGPEVTLDVSTASGAKCERCWRVLPEVGKSTAHPTLCLRCESVVESLPA